MVEGKTLPKRILNAVWWSLCKRLERNSNLHDRGKIHIGRAAETIVREDGSLIVRRRITINRRVCRDERQLIQSAECGIQDIYRRPCQKDHNNNRSDTPGQRKHRF